MPDFNSTATITQYDFGNDFDVPVNLPEGVNSLDISVDNGRIYISVNGEHIYESLSFGSDSNITVSRD